MRQEKTGIPGILFKGQHTKSDLRAFNLVSSKGLTTVRQLEIGFMVSGRWLERQPPMPLSESLSHTTFSSYLSWVKHIPPHALQTPCGPSLPGSHLAEESASCSQPVPSLQSFLRGFQRDLGTLKECEKHKERDLMEWLQGEGCFFLHVQLVML